MFCFAERMQRINGAPNADDLKSQISDLKSLAESCSRQLRGWADALQNSDIKGQRHLNESSRRKYDQRQRSETFMAALDAIRSGADPASVLTESPSSDP